MKSVTMTMWRRPAYALRVLDSLGCQENHAVGVDYRFFPAHDSQTEPIGCDASILRAVQSAFSMGSDFNVHIEDDTVLSPDALALCSWFYTHPERDHYTLLCLHSHSRDESGPLSVVEDDRFQSWGWACTREMWERYFLPEWNQKQQHPKGWDWSVGLTLQRHRLKVLRPVLSRVKNIGRENGTYETPEHYDTWAPQLVQSKGGYGHDFQITQRITTLRPMDDWAREELGLQAHQ